eukprot:1266818-Prymnesium_polylepis.1
MVDAGKPSSEQLTVAFNAAGDLVRAGQGRGSTTCHRACSSPPCLLAPPPSSSRDRPKPSRVQFATAGVDCKLRLFRFKDAALLCEGVGHSGRVRTLQFSPDSKQLISAGDDGGILLWNVFPE